MLWICLSKICCSRGDNVVEPLGASGNDSILRFASIVLRMDSISGSSSISDSNSDKSFSGFFLEVNNLPTRFRNVRINDFFFGSEGDVEVDMSIILHGLLHGRLHGLLHGGIMHIHGVRGTVQPGI